MRKPFRTPDSTQESPREVDTANTRRPTNPETANIPIVRAIKTTTESFEYSILWMFFAKTFDIWMVRGIEINDARIIMIIILVKSGGVIVISWETATAAPVLDFERRNNATKEIAMTRVLIEPRRIRNCFLESDLEIDLPMIAAWLLPRPGRREQIGETRIVVMVGRISSFFGRGSFSKFCFGTFDFTLIE